MFVTLMDAGSKPLATVPKARFEAFRFETVFPPPMKKGAVTLPDALRPVRVPTDVMFVWAVASCAAATTPKARFEAFRFDTVFPPPMKKGAVTLPDALRPVRVPTEVILVWAVASWVAATTPNAKFEAFKLLRVLPPPMKKGAVTFPDALRPVRVPRDVTLVWADCTWAAPTAPNARFEAFKLLKVFPPPMKKGAVTLPDALRPVRVPRDVTLVWADCT